MSNTAEQLDQPTGHTELRLPVVKGYTNARGVYAALSEPYQPFDRAPEIQSIITMFVQWNEDAIDAGKPGMPDSFERLFPTDIDYIDNAKLHDVDYKGRPHGKKYLAEQPPFEQRQRRMESESFGSVAYKPMETPFITTEQRIHIQSMFPVDDFPFAYILRIQLAGKRNKNFNSLMVIEPDNVAGTQLSMFLMLSGNRENDPVEGE